MIQLVGYDEVYNESLDEYWKGIVKDDTKASRIVAIMGPQSSGKSTILNRLFGTKFVTMDEDRGRYQVTQGIWLGYNSDSNLAIVDLEGTDSRERGEDATTFERKSALFALSISQVLIINLWAQDVGRLNASNMLLLRTVLEQDLLLFHQNSGDSSGFSTKTRMLFLLRDHDLGTPLDFLADMLRTDLEKIWMEVTESTMQKNTSIGDFFDPEFVSLPHKILMPDEFEKGCNSLREKFLAESGGMFRDEYDRDLSLDGFPVFAKSVWETIRADKELDLPAQRDLVAAVRCDDYKQRSLAEAEKTFEVLETAISTDGTDLAGAHICERLADVMGTAVDMFDQATTRYPQKAPVKRSELETALKSRATGIFGAYMDKVAKKQTERVAADLRAQTASEGFGARMANTTQECMKEFDDKCSPPAELFTDAFASARQKLLTSIETQVDRARQAAVRSCLVALKEKFTAELAPPAGAVLERSPRAFETVWFDLSELFRTQYAALKALALSQFGPEGLLLKEDATREALANLQETCTKEAQQQVLELLGSHSVFSARVKQCFYDLFRNDSSGLPRVWGPDDDITSVYDEALESAGQFTRVLSVVELTGLESPDDQLPRQQLFNAAEMEDVKAALRSEAEAAFAEAKRSQDAMRAQMMGVQGQLPIWMVAGLVVVGFDDAVYMLRNPLLLILCVVVSLIGYVGYVLNIHVFLKQRFRQDMHSVLHRTKRMLDEVVPNEDAVSSATSVASTSVTSTNSVG